MAEYIEREATIEALKDNVTEMESYIYYGSNEGVPKDEIEDIVNEIPAADVVEVKHGYIIETVKNGKFNRVFSCCGKDYTQLTQWMLPKYCPNCGAKMDGDKSD